MKIIEQCYGKGCAKNNFFLNEVNNFPLTNNIDKQKIIKWQMVHKKALKKAHLLLTID